MNQTDPTTKSATKKLVIVAVLFVILAPFVWLGWRDLWTIFLEKSEPVLILKELPSGIGITPATLHFTAEDKDSGLDEVVVRLRQRGRNIELFRQKYKRTKLTEVSVELPSDPTQILAGNAEIEISLFDASFWNNKHTQTLQLSVDYRRPKVEVISTQHNVRLGGSQLAIYQIKEDNILVHGVRVGRKTFFGVPLKNLDGSFTDSTLFAALFSIDSNFADSQSIKIFAEDQVGNGASTTFYYRALPSPPQSEKVKLSQEYLDRTIFNLYDENFAAIQSRANLMGIDKLPDPVNTGPISDKIEMLKFVRKELAAWSESELNKQLKNFRDSRQWEQPNLAIPGTVLSSYGRMLQFEYAGKVEFEDRQNGYEIVPVNSIVVAANNGIVAYVGNIGSFGQLVAIDHGLGLFSIYAWLGEVTVKTGDKVKIGQQIAYTGSSGLGKGREYFYGLSLHGNLVDAREWSDKAWYYAHIVDKVNQAKTKYGLPPLIGQLSELY